jgi:hypothetical protein
VTWEQSHQGLLWQPGLRPWEAAVNHCAESPSPVSHGRPGPPGLPFMHFMRSPSTLCPAPPEGPPTAAPSAACPVLGQKSKATSPTPARQQNMSPALKPQSPGLHLAPWAKAHQDFLFGPWTHRLLAKGLLVTQVLCQPCISGPANICLFFGSTGL